MQIDLSGRVMLITGGSRGIGRQTALLIGSCGAKVALTYATRREAADEVVATIGEERALAIRADAGAPADVKRMVEATIARFGKIDILVNNAAIHSINPFDGDDYVAWQHGWQRTIEVNLFGAANAAFLVIPGMKKQGGGKIINVASRSGFRGELEFPDYGASKAGMMNLTKSLARTHAKHGIIATCVAPGYVETETSAHDLERFRERIEGEIPLGRVAQPDEVAKTILFLASPLSDYLAGVTIDVNGGSYLR